MDRIKSYSFTPVSGSVRVLVDLESGLKAYLLRKGHGAEVYIKNKEFVYKIGWSSPEFDLVKRIFAEKANFIKSRNKIY